MRIALVGNQNSGKTTLFNQLTGSNQHVGNFPGVTVDIKRGKLRGNNKLEIIDLPGIYSLLPYSEEELLARDFITNQNIDAIINIVDATNLDRNLYLTLQLLSLEIPLVVALNMMDEAKNSNIFIDLNKLEEMLHVKVVPISALRQEGLLELIDKIQNVYKEKNIVNADFLFKKEEKIFNSIQCLKACFDKNNAIKFHHKYLAIHLLETDESSIPNILKKEDKEQLKEEIEKLENYYHKKHEEIFVEIRYKYIESITSKCVRKNNEITKEQKKSLNIDRILTHKYFGLPIFLLIIMFIFYLSFGSLGPLLSDLLATFLNDFNGWSKTILLNCGVSNTFVSLLVDGIFEGVGSVLSFVPTILILFLCLSILEDSGYMARIAFMIDKPMRKVGLSGKAFVPMILGFGCSVPAILATRTLHSSRDRRLTIFLIPFMSCSAKLPIYALISLVFFKAQAPIVISALYLGGIVLALLAALMIKLIFNSKPIPFIMELPAYRFPSFKSTTLLMWEKAKDFLKKAFSVILIASIAVWFLENFNARFEYVTDSNNSLLAIISQAITPIFKPLGFAKWEITASLITGLSAKETILSTLEILLGSASNICALIGPLESLSLLVFISLYMPCIAAFAAIKKELHSTFEAIMQMIFQTSFAWLITFAVYQIGKVMIMCVL